MDELKPDIDWPEPVGLCTGESSLAIARLTLEQKRLLWAHLKQYHPQYAQKLSIALGSVEIKEVMQTFSASVLIDKALLPEALKPLAEIF